MVKNRVTSSGVSTSLAEKRGTGAAYADCLLSELELPDLATWLAELTPQGDEALRAGVSSLLVQMEKKIHAGEPWRNGSWKGADTERAIVMSHFNELMYSLRACINASRASCGRVTLLSNGWFGEIAAYKSLKAAMAAKFASAAKAQGRELEQRRERTLTDYQRLDMYRSMLSLSVRSSHLAAKARPDAARKVVTTLTLCLMVSLYSAIGQRGLNLDDLLWGGLQLAGWTTSYQWAGYKPTLLQVSTGFKGGGAGSIKLFQIMPHRDVMQCSISMLGLYFLYQFILLVDPLPSIKEWITTGHNVSLFRKQTQGAQEGGVRSITSYNPYLKEELEAINADSSFTFHSFRNARIADAGTDHGASRPDIMHGAGHSTGGSHSVSYNAVDAPWVVSGAGYRGTEPEMLAPQVKLLELYRHGEEYCDDAEELLQLAFSSRKEEWASLRDAASSSNDEDGAKACRWIDVVRHSVLSFLIGCAFRPRDRFGVIDTDMPIKQKLLGDEIVADVRMRVIFESEVFARLLERAARFEQAEVEAGELANVGAQERRVRSQISGMEHRLSSLPAEVAASVAPALDEEAQLRLDGEWLQRHNSERIQFYGSKSRLDDFSPCDLKPGDPQLRQMRLEAEERERKRAREQTSIQQWFAPPLLVRMAVGCDLCRADGIPASAQCPHLPKRQRLADPAPPAPSSSVEQAAGGAADEELLRKLAVLEAEKAELTRKLSASEELNRNLRAATADPAKEASVSATVPLIRTLKNVQHLVKVYLKVVGPLELDHAWRLPPQVKEDEADRQKRLVAGYVNVVIVVLHACTTDDFSDVWQAAERTERRKMTFTALASEARTLTKERRAFIADKLKDPSIFARLLSLLQEVPEPPPAPPPAAIVEATAASSSTDPLTRFYVAFDPSMTTGVARFAVQDGTLKSIKLGLLRLPSTGSSGSRCLSLFDTLPQWVDGATQAFVEPYFAHGPAASGAALNFEIRGAIKMALARASVEYAEVPSGKWKKAVAKKGDATKAAARAAVEALLSITLPPSIIMDTSDALCIGVCGLMGRGVSLGSAVAVEVA